jgi:O-antigen/teichoic acid export membrane protein
MRATTAWRFVRIRPFDISTESGRTHERYRVAMVTILANVCSRALGMCGMVLGVGLTTPYLGSERFGVWMTIASLTAMLSLLDLGTGNALTNHVARVAARGEDDTLRRAITGGLGFMAVIGAVAALLLLGVAAVLPWDRLLKLSDPLAATEARQAAMVFAVMFGINILSTGIQKVFIGLQRGFEAHAAAGLGSLLTIAGLVAATSGRAGVPTLLLVTSASQTVSALLLAMLLVRRRQLGVQRLTQTIRIEGSDLMRVSLLFLVLQVGTMVGWGADVLIISSQLGASHAALYSVTDRLFQFVAIPLGVVNAPLWAAYADAHARNDTAFIRRTLKSSLGLTLSIATIGSTALLLAASPLIERWTHGTVQADQSVVVAFALWTILSTTGNAFAMFLNGVGFIRPQVVSVFLFCSIATPMKFLLMDRFGTAGLLLATIGSYTLAVPLLYATLFRPLVTEALLARPSRRPVFRAFR